MSKDSIEVVICIVLIESCVNQNFSWSQEQHENEVEEISVRHGSTKPTLNHVCRQDKESYQRPIEESLGSFGKSHLNLVSVLEEQVADCRKVLESYVTNSLKVS